MSHLFDRNTAFYTITDNLYRHEWQKLEIGLGLVDSFRVTNPKRRVYSYTHTNGSSRSRIDRIYISSDIQGTVLSSVYENTFSSDHKILHLNLANEINTGPGHWIFNNSLLSDIAFVEGINDIIDQYTTAATDDFPNQKTRWDFLKQNMASYAQNYSKNKSKEKKL